MRATFVLALLTLPVAAQAAPPQGITVPRLVDFFYEPAGSEPAGRGGAKLEFATYGETLVLDADEDFERHIRFELHSARTLKLPETLPIAVVDTALGEDCELDEASAAADLTMSLVEAPPGWSHFARPMLCELKLGKRYVLRGGEVSGEVVVRRPKVAPLDEAVSWLFPVQPLAAPARSYRFDVQFGPDQSPRVEGIGWSLELPTNPVDDERRSTAIELEGVGKLVVPAAMQTLSGRLPQWHVSTAGSWDDINRAHRDLYDLAAEPHGPVLGLAGRVLGLQDPVAAVREALRLSLDEIAFDPAGGRGSLWQAPRAAELTVEEGRGTAVDRAALLVSLLRTAELRAEVLFMNSTAHPVSSKLPVAQLNQVLVLIPGVALEAGAGPLYVDPSRGSAWLGAISEDTLGSDALLLSPTVARWLRLGEDSPPRKWSWAAAELKDGTFQISTTGVLEGAPAARVRSWDRAGRPAESLPSQDLAWLAGLGMPADTAIEDVPGGRLQVAWQGTVPRELLLVGGTLPLPELPAVALGPKRTRRDPFPLDSSTFDLDVTESWTFRGLRPGESAVVGPRTTPFWDVEAQSAWSGPVLNRRYHLRFSAREIAPAAAHELGGFYAYVESTLGSAQPPPK